MKRFAAYGQFVAFTSLLAMTATVARADLRSEVDAVLRDKLLQRATVSIEIVALGDAPATSRVLLRQNGAQPLVPASNLKVVTTAAALSTLGASFNFDTRLVRQDDNVAIVGDGDPTLGDAELVRQYGWTTTTIFDSWSGALYAAGVRNVADVVVDDSAFEQAFVHPNWPADQLDLRYVAGVAGLNLNANCLDFYLGKVNRGALVTYAIDPPTKYAIVRNGCVGGPESATSVAMARDGSHVVTIKGTSPGTRVAVSATVDDPPLLAGTVLSESLARAGITVAGTVRRDRTLRAALAVSPDGPLAVVAHHRTPIAAVLARANKDSMNLYAEALCKRLGLAITGESGSWQNGPLAVGAFLSKLGVPPEQFTIDDGCGLSKRNAISAEAMTRVLQHMYFSADHQAFIDSLAIAGVDGTLVDRFRNTDLRNRLYGKSGFVNGVSCLSGYFRGQNDRWYAFSILMNGIPAKSNSSIKPLQERIVRAAYAETR